VRMPYASSSQDSLEDAQRVIDATGVQSLTIPITNMVDPYLVTIPKDAKLRRANLMPRVRMLVLYDQSAAFKGLVVGTSNKTEILLGYSTIFGDSASAFNPIGDLYKTQVRQLSEHLGVPKEIMDKPPSADLWVDQTDEQELGFTYAEVDKLFALLIDQRYSPEDCVAAGFDQVFVEDVMRRVRQNHYKRVMPPIAKLSNRTIGYDFLYLRDWGT
jgi:NAD+ synthase